MDVTEYNQMVIDALFELAQMAVDEIYETRIAVIKHGGKAAPPNTQKLRDYAAAAVDRLSVSTIGSVVNLRQQPVSK